VRSTRNYQVCTPNHHNFQRSKFRNKASLLSNFKSCSINTTSRKRDSRSLLTNRVRCCAKGSSTDNWPCRSNSSCSGNSCFKSKTQPAWYNQLPLPWKRRFLDHQHSFMARKFWSLNEWCNWKLTICSQSQAQGHLLIIVTKNKSRKSSSRTFWLKFNPLRSDYNTTRPTFNSKMTMSVREWWRAARMTLQKDLALSGSKTRHLLCSEPLQQGAKHWRSYPRPWVRVLWPRSTVSCRTCELSLKTTIPR